MLRLRDLGANTPSGVPYTKEEILALVRKGKQRGHILGIDEMLASRDKTIDEAKEEAKRTKRELSLLRRVVMSDNRMSHMFTHLGSQSEIDGGSESGSGGGGDDEPGGDEDAGGDDDI
ncbi:hypothetical protein Tco_0579350 [Tanacetum coccineum]